MIKEAVYDEIQKMRNNNRFRGFYIEALYKKFPNISRELIKECVDLLIEEKLLKIRYYEIRDPETLDVVLITNHIDDLLNTTISTDLYEEFYVTESSVYTLYK